MGLPHYPIFSLHFLLFFTLTHSKSPLDYTALVYKGCAKQPLSDPTGAYSQALSSLFNSLLQQSIKFKFYKTTINAAQTTISGLYQCRGDLSAADCYTCISKVTQLTVQLCGKVSAARVQLFGCYAMYEVSGFTQISGLELLYKACSPTKVGGSGFEVRRETAFTMMQNGLVSGNGFYATSYESMYMLGQCEGDLGSSDCEGCVKFAVEKVKVSCGSSLSGQVYLYKCFIGYSYYPNGVPRRSSSSGLSSGNGQNIGKTVAIIVGGAAAVGFLVIFALFLRGLAKKHDDDF